MDTYNAYKSLVSQVWNPQNDEVSVEVLQTWKQVLDIEVALQLRDGQCGFIITAYQWFDLKACGLVTNHSV